MNTGRILKTGLALGVVANAYDFVMNNYIISSMMQAPFMNDMKSVSVTWMVIGDFVGALVFVWFFDLVRGSFGAGAKGGATYGFCAALLMNFPLWIFMHLFVKGFSYALAWEWTCLGLLWGVIGGAVAGIVYDKTGPATA